jgi:hypothetical protein
MVAAQVHNLHMHTAAATMPTRAKRQAQAQS